MAVAVIVLQNLPDSDPHPEILRKATRSPTAPRRHDGGVSLSFTSLTVEKKIAKERNVQKTKGKENS